LREFFDKSSGARRGQRDFEHAEARLREAVDGALGQLGARQAQHRHDALRYELVFDERT
jgi:hypothetical protein